MKVGILLLSILLFSSTLYADDVFILGDSYSGNTDNKWKNRLEDASGGNHTVTSVTSMPADTSSYEQIYDIRYSNTHVISSSMETHYKALLARGGTLYLQTIIYKRCYRRQHNNS